MISIAKEDMYKTIFGTPWGTYAYMRMAYELMNVGATFQCTMDVALSNFIFKFIVVYEDDIMVFSQKSQ